MNQLILSGRPEGERCKDSPIAEHDVEMVLIQDGFNTDGWVLVLSGIQEIMMQENVKGLPSGIFCPFDGTCLRSKAASFTLQET